MSATLIYILAAVVPVVVVVVIVIVFVVVLVRRRRRRPRLVKTGRLYYFQTKQWRVYYSVYFGLWTWVIIKTLHTFTSFTMYTVCLKNWASTI